MACNATGRISLGALIDIFHFKNVYIVVTIIQVYISDFFDYLLKNIRLQSHA